MILCIVGTVGLLCNWLLSSKATEENKSQTADTYQSKDENSVLGSQNNPFTILEIVPNKSLAEIGYLIPGCEPVDYEDRKSVV